MCGQGKSPLCFLPSLPFLSLPSPHSIFTSFSPLPLICQPTWSLFYPIPSPSIFPSPSLSMFPHISTPPLLWQPPLFLHPSPFCQYAPPISLSSLPLYLDLLLMVRPCETLGGLPSSPCLSVRCRTSSWPGSAPPYQACRTICSVSMWPQSRDLDGDHSVLLNIQKIKQ